MLGKGAVHEFAEQEVIERGPLHLAVSGWGIARASRLFEELIMSALARGRPVSRISISLPEDLLNDLDQMVEARRFNTRSHAVNDMLHQFLMEHKGDQGSDVMAGIIALFYKNNVRGLQNQLADLQSRYIDEVISSLHVQLVNNQTMEVILVQGPARKLQTIADEMISLRGVISGKIHLVAALMPQLHPFIQDAKQA
jgi:CopG family nickel-responsive transcriptional regulator